MKTIELNDDAETSTAHNIETKEDKAIDADILR